MLVFQTGPGAHRRSSLPYISRVSITAFVIVFLLSLVPTTGAALTNRTIDDTIGDVTTLFRPIYRPPTLGVWEGNTCRTCAIQPDRELAFDGTWTAATYNPGIGSMSIELSFPGVAIYVYFILANDQGDGITTKTVCDFILDGRPAGSFIHEPTDSPLLEYNSLVFARVGLTNTTHNLTIETTGITDENIFVNFDYSIYTFDNGSEPVFTPSPSPSPSPPPTTSATTAPSASGNTQISPALIGVIIAAIVGSVALIAIVLVVWYCHRRRRSRVGPRPLSTIDEPPIMVSLPFPDANGPRPSDVSAHISPIANSNVYGLGGYAYGGGPGNGNTTYAGSEHMGTDGQSIPSGSNIGLTTVGDGAYRRNIVHYQGSHDIMSTLPTGELILTPATPKRQDTFGDPIEQASIASNQTGPTLSTALTTANATPEELRQARQEELRRQMAAIRRELDELRTEAVRKSSIKKQRLSEREEDMDMMALREQILMLREQIEFLQNQQQSPWAQGLSDELPPRYTPAPSHYLAS
ncbi:hypothetical protein AX16_006672 [Volvariella volvacea WC 439]|nr:hypothetical protein AX16_006672 [Volvariella volvacea WC 439]